VNPSDLIALCAHLLAVLVLLSLVGGRSRKAWRIRFAILVGCILIGLPGVQRGIFGDLSAASIVACVGFLIGTATEQVRTLLRITFVLALPLYVTSLSGIGPDLYALGFSQWWLVVPLAAFGFWSVSQERFWITLWVLLALVMTALPIHESSNLWDALVDVPAAVAGLVAWCIGWKASGKASST